MAKRRQKTRAQKRSQAWVGGLVAGAILVFAGLISWYGVTALQDKKEAKQNTVETNTTKVQNESNTSNVTGESTLLATDDRILITPDTIDQYRKNADGSPICDPGFVVAPATTTVRYEDPVGRFELQIPFNPDWGSEDYRVAGFDILDKPEGGDPDIKSTTQFGAIRGGEGCGWYRYGRLSVREQRSFEEIQADLQDELIFAELKPRQATVGEFKIAEYSMSGLCGQPTVEVIGDDYNIVLSYICGTAPVEEDQAELREIIESLKLL